MDETGIMLSMLGSIKVLIGKDNIRDYRGAGVKRTMVTAIECLSVDGRSLLPLIIWPASTHRSNWTTYPTPGWRTVSGQSSKNIEPEESNSTAPKSTVPGQSNKNIYCMHLIENLLCRVVHCLLSASDSLQVVQQLVSRTIASK
jgi:hypothetical protein